MKRKKICVVIGTAMNLNSLYKDQFNYLIENGFDVTGVAPKGIEHDWLRGDGIKTKVINIERTPSPLKDLISLVNLTWFFCFNRFDIVSVSTPKASLLGALAAFFTFHRNIIYTLRGRAYETSTGIKRRFFEVIELFICSVSKKVFCISHELKEDFVNRKLCASSKIFVIGKGSSNGVDLNIFTKNEKTLSHAQSIRDKYGLKETDILLLNSGRLRKDKGINELVRAFRELSKDYSNVYLLLQGKIEEFDPLENDVIQDIEKNEKIFLEGWSKSIEIYLAACDIFVFPTHREGFGNVALEASAMEKPVVAFDVIGCRESVNNGVSGILCGPISVQNLKSSLELLIVNRDKRIELGKMGRLWIESNFRSENIWEKLVEVYDSMLKK